MNKSAINILASIFVLLSLSLPYLNLWASSVSLSIHEGRRVGFRESYMGLEKR